MMRTQEIQELGPYSNIRILKVCRVEANGGFIIPVGDVAGE